MQSACIVCNEQQAIERAQQNAAVRDFVEEMKAKGYATRVAAHWDKLASAWIVIIDSPQVKDYGMALRVKRDGTVSIEQGEKG